MDYSVTTTVIKLVGTIGFKGNNIQSNTAAVSWFVLAYWGNIYKNKATNNAVQMDFTAPELGCLGDTSSNKESAVMEPTFIGLWLTEQMNVNSQVNTFFFSVRHVHQIVLTQNSPSITHRRLRCNNLLGVWTSWWRDFVVLGFRWVLVQYIHGDRSHWGASHTGNKAEQHQRAKFAPNNDKSVYLLWW